MEASRSSAFRVSSGILAAVCAIMVLKLLIFRATGSAAVLGDALESVVNILTAGLVMFSTWYAARPADPEHPYGHGRIEFIAAGIEGAVILLAGVGIAAEAVRRWLGGATVREPGLGALAMVGMAILLACLGGWVVRRGRRLHSESLIADGRHLMVDGLSTAGVAVALALVAWTGWRWLDPVAAILVCGLVCFAGVRLMRRSFSGLLDRADGEDLRTIHGILDDAIAAGDIDSYEKVRLRHDGAHHWVDMHLRFPADATVKQAHDMASAIEQRIEQELGEANASSHIEPSRD